MGLHVCQICAIRNSSTLPLPGRANSAIVSAAQLSEAWKGSISPCEPVHGIGMYMYLSSIS